jgi:nucleoside-diphosphate-sugar epimerase
MKVLITGAGGFIGSHLTDSQLEKGNHVRAVDLHVERLSHVKEHERIELMVGDITNPELVKSLVTDIEVVYHLASAHLDVSLSDEHYRQVNVHRYVRSLVEAAYQAGVRRFVHCSSVGVMGAVENPPADESYSHRLPISTSLLSAKETGRARFRQLRMVFRLSLPDRPGYMARAALVLKSYFVPSQKDASRSSGSGQNWRHPVYVSDAVKGLELCAMVDDWCGGAYIIAGSEPVRVIELVHLISQELASHHPDSTCHLPWVGLGGLGIETLFKILRKQPPFSRRSLDFFQKDNAYDIGKARRELGYHPEIDLLSGIQQTVRWLNTHLHNKKGFGLSVEQPFRNQFAYLKESRKNG